MESASFGRFIESIQEILEGYDLFFVCGAPKSGTTWVQRALNAHPEIVCAGEGHFADKFARGINDALKSYYIHQQVVTRNVYEGNGYYRHNQKSELAFLAKSFILSTFAQLQIPKGTRLVGDKTPANVDYLGLFHSLFPEAKFVNVVRDGRDTLVSTFKHVERVNLIKREIDDLNGFFLKKAHYYSSRWVEALKKADTFATEHPGVLYTVRYEDLKRDFGAAFSDMLRFLDVDASGDAIRHCEAETSFKRLSGGRDAGNEDPNAFLRKGIVGDWKVALQPQHLEIFYAVGAEWLERFGYENGSGSQETGEADVS